MRLSTLSCSAGCISENRVWKSSSVRTERPADLLNATSGDAARFGVSEDPRDEFELSSICVNVDACTVERAVADLATFSFSTICALRFAAFSLKFDLCVGIVFCAGGGVYWPLCVRRRD